MFCAVGLAAIGIYAVTSTTTVKGAPASEGVDIGSRCELYAQPPLSNDFWNSSRDVNPGFNQQSADDAWERVFDGGDGANIGIATAIRVGETVECLEREDANVVGSGPARPDATEYETGTITALLVALGSFALLAVGGVLIWTRNGDETVDGSTINPRQASPEAEKPNPSDPVQVAVPDGKNAADALRQLKALHDEGILTDNEYETKRKAVADRL